MVSTFEDLGIEIRNLRRLADRNVKTWSAFNPSIACDDRGNYAVALRSSNYVILDHGELSVTTGGPIRNRVYFAELDSNFKIIDEPRMLDFSAAGIDVPRGVEDPKLLWRDGRWVFTGVFLERNVPVARNCICYLDEAATKVIRVDILPGYETKRPEKNWMTAANKPKNFDYIYDGNAIVRGNEVIHRLRDNAAISALRGNAHLVELLDGSYLGIMHQLHITKATHFSPTTFGMQENVFKDYHHFFVRFDNNGWAIEISEPFQFISRGIEFAAGIAEHEDNYVISFGKNDLSSHLAFIKKDNVMKMMKSVD